MGRIVLFLTCATAAAGCATTAGNTDLTCQSMTVTQAQRPANWRGTVFTLVMENKNRSDIVGNTGEAPYLNQLIAQNALAAGYHDPYIHPSEPNYLWMAAGENFGILDDNDPSSHSIAATSHIADQIEKAGLTWRAYEESMGAPCGLSSQGEYGAKHDPFVFFDDINGWDGSAFQPSTRCTTHVVDFSQFDVDVAAGNLPDYVFITPNLDDDMHDGTIQQGDQWAATQVPKILASPAYLNGGVLFILWDEGDGLPAGDDPPFIAISPQAKHGYVSNVDYDTSSYLLTVEKMLGVNALPCGFDPGSAASMDDLFTSALPAAIPAQ